MKALLFALFVLACFCIGYFLAAAIEPRRKPKQEPAPDTINLDLNFTQFESKK